MSKVFFGERREGEVLYALTLSVDTLWRFPLSLTP